VKLMTPKPRAQTKVTSQSWVRVTRLTKINITT
jgi:hypothetical protein